MKSTVGRPRRVTDEQIATILAWHDSILAWRAQRKNLKTIDRLMEELGLARGTISYVIKHRGEFKQAAPELRQTEIQTRHKRMKQLRPSTEGFSKDAIRVRKR